MTADEIVKLKNKLDKQQTVKRSRYIRFIDWFTKYSLKTRIFGTIGLFVFLWLFGWPTTILLYDIALYNLTVQRDEHVFLTGQQEIHPEYNTYSVQGCHQLPCNPDNSIYFRITSSYFNQIWSWINEGQIFFPDYVAAAIPNIVSKCVITTYGFRAKLFMRSAEIYPDLLTASCSPIDMKDANTP